MGKKQPSITHVSKVDYARHTNRFGAQGITPRCKACGGNTWFRSARGGTPSAFVCQADGCQAEIRSA